MMGTRSPLWLSEDDAVRILTIHKCKGLEFEKVVVLGGEHELFSSPQATEIGPSSSLLSPGRKAN